ncbi:uncharacterized protein B0P05DRAFT_217731 [Gilbertella persicaria]|uniref:uncharacterized protein n=1 Tax=Gilbertella persicaria TaxID=101096 RepID=UPI002220337C|nr:uncharacterized protein B0P05DRAFT_217731 [Gilbertella persicaria]KAI8092153.1 hypothetical protein B0P05DRAFT_217731 [Gilbertella persicaria]
MNNKSVVGLEAEILLPAANNSTDLFFEAADQGQEEEDIFLSLIDEEDKEEIEDLQELEELEELEEDYGSFEEESIEGDESFEQEDYEGAQIELGQKGNHQVMSWDDLPLDNTPAYIPDSTVSSPPSPPMANTGSSDNMQKKPSASMNNTRAAAFEADFYLGSASSLLISPWTYFVTVAAILIS